MRKTKIVILLVALLASNIFANEEYNVKPGWNLLGTGLSDDEVNLPTTAINPNIKLIWTYDSEQGWGVYSPRESVTQLIQESSFNMIQTIEPGSGVWILSDGSSEFNTSITGSLSTITGSLKFDNNGNIEPIVDANVTISNNTATFNTTTDSTGNYIFSDIPAGVYAIYFEAAGFNSISGEISLTTTSHTYPQVRMQSSVDPVENYTYTFNGTIIDAITGTGIENAQLTLTNGFDNQLGIQVASATSNSTGVYSFTSVPSGNYTLIVSKDGYIKNVSNIQLQSSTDGDTITQDFTLAPYSENMRIVLSWGEAPSDLDSHLAKMNNDTRDWHVYYSNRDEMEANLDVDDTSSYGPETITLSTIENDAVYKYYIHNYTNAYSDTSDALSNSGANVKVYVGNNEYVFNVPNYPGTIWKVFEIVQGNIIPCVGSECMSFESDSGSENFGLMRVIQNTEIDFSKLPQK